MDTCRGARGAPSTLIRVKKNQIIVSKVQQDCLILTKPLIKDFSKTKVGAIKFALFEKMKKSDITGWLLKNGPLVVNLYNSLSKISSNFLGQYQNKPIYQPFLKVS